jgi:predicted flap endonuclease-1-like 5' DNA nuclease
MSLLDKLKSLLGLGGSGSTSNEERDVGVTVEREGRRGTDADTERAVKESPPADDGTTADPTESTDEADGHAAADTEDEPDDAAEDGAETARADTGTADADAESADEESRVHSEAVDVVKGIGPTYADRLSEAGVETVADLAEADAADLAERADVPEGRVENWIEQAKARRR